MAQLRLLAFVDFYDNIYFLTIVTVIPGSDLNPCSDVSLTFI